MSQWSRWIRVPAAPPGVRTTRPSALATGLALAAALVLSGCERERPGEWNLIVISLDTLRADRLGCYGYDRPTSPAIDAFAGRGARFAWTVAECSWTLPSHVTLFSGLMPGTHGVTLPSLQVGTDTELLPEMLLARGYRTLGLTDGAYMSERHGFDRGFEFFDDEDKGLAATLERSLSEMDALKTGERFFHFLHTYDIHCPYTPSPATLEQFRSPESRPIDTEGRCGNPEYNAMMLHPDQVRFISDSYDALIREADDRLASFFAELERRGRLEDTVIMIVSDHGEEFREHGQIGHERTLYREVLLVPWIVVGPGIQAGVLRTGAGLVDLVPTALNLLGIDPREGLEGVDHAPLLRGERTEPASPGETGSDEPMLGEGRASELHWQFSLRSWFDPRTHLIQNRKTGRAQLFSVPEDPAQLTDRAPQEPDVVSALTERMNRALTPARVRSALPMERLTSEQRERLRSLGYIN